MAIHIIDDEELNARMTRVVNKVLDIFDEEKFTAKDVLWFVKVIEWMIEDEYREKQDVTKK